MAEEVRARPASKPSASTFSDRISKRMEDTGCNIQKPDNSSLLSISYSVFSALETILGMLLNAFIVTVNCTHGMKNRQLKSIDKILTALGISRFCYLAIFLVRIFWASISSSAFEMIAVYRTFKTITWFLTSVNFCFSACLGLFYCVKIADFRHLLFIHLKMGISKWIPWMLLGSVLGSLMNTSPFFRGIYTITCKNNSDADPSGNRTFDQLSLETNRYDLLLYGGIGFSMTFSAAIASSCLLLFSLWRHTRRMQNSSTGFSDPRMAAHFQALKTVASLLVIDSVDFVGVMILLSNVFSETSPAHQLVTIIVYACPSVQSQILIWGTPKLKRVFVRVMDSFRHSRRFILYL